MFHIFAFRIPQYKYTVIFQHFLAKLAKDMCPLTTCQLSMRHSTRPWRLWKLEEYKQT